MRFGYLLVLTLLTSCGADEPEVKRDPIVVYAPGDASSEFAALLAEFSEATSVPVSIKWGKSGENTDAVINKTGVPADILITDNVADIWRAADEGALRPIESEALGDVSDLIRDRDRYWTSIGVHPAVGVGKPDDEAVAGDYAACFLSSSHPLSRSFIANQIQAQGVRDAERFVRRFVAELEREPFETQNELVAAVRDGKCEVGIISNLQVQDLTLLDQQGFDAVTVDAVGVGRHSRYPESAQLFVDWLIRERPVEVPELLKIPVSVAGYRDEEARLLAERAGYH